MTENKLRIKNISLQNFKKFENLKIIFENENGETINKKIVACVGKNGSGKSSIFDAFYFRSYSPISRIKNVKPNAHLHLLETDRSNKNKQYFIYDYEKNKEKYDNKHSRELARAIKTDINFFNVHDISSETFYLRSPYRISIDPIVHKQLEDEEKIQKNSNEIDGIIRTSFSKINSLVDKKAKEKNQKKPYREVEANLIKEFNKIIFSLLEIKIKEIGNYNIQGEGQLFFIKIFNEQETTISYINLSAGEKEILEIFLDLWIKIKDCPATIFCIDEPELHINSEIQKKFLIELNKLIPDNCQIWINTHSIGMIRALQSEELNDDSTILNFSDIKENEKGQLELRPMKKTYKNFSKLFEIALDDISELISPEKIIICEGKIELDENGKEEGFDAEIYQTIFEEKYPNIKFVSAGGVRQTKTYKKLVTHIFPKILKKVKIFRLNDGDNRDSNTKTEEGQKKLKRYSIESYLFDWEIVKPFIREKIIEEVEAKHKEIVNDINNEPQKNNKLKIFNLINKNGFKKFLNIDEMYINLAKNIKEKTLIYKKLEKIIFEET